MIIAADIFDFLSVFLPVLFLTHLVFRIGLAYGRSHGTTLLFAGSSIIVFSYLFKIYFDIMLGSVDTYWLFVLTLTASIGVILAFAGTSRVQLFLLSTRGELKKPAAKGAKIAAAVAVVFSISMMLYFLTFRRPIYWRLGGVCSIIIQVALFGIVLTVGELFSITDRHPGSTKARAARILASYYLVEPALWWTIVRGIGVTAHHPAARLVVNLLNAVVSLSVALLIINFIYSRLPNLLRQMRPTYIDTLRVRVLRDLYLIGTGLVIFVFVVLLAAEALYGNLRKGTLESYAQMRLSVGRLAAAKIESTLQDVAMRLQRSEESFDARQLLSGLQTEHNFVEAVGSGDTSNTIMFNRIPRFRWADSLTPTLFKQTVQRTGKNGVSAVVERDNHGLQSMVTVRNRGRNGKISYAFALIDLQKVLANSIIDVNGYGRDLELLTKHLNIVYSSHEDEIGEDFEDAVLSEGLIRQNDLRKDLLSLSRDGYEGFRILRGENQAGVGEYFMLVTTPIQFQGYEGILASVEPEGRVSGIFRPTDSLLVLAGVLIVVLFGGTLVIISVAFKWSVRLEKEVQNKVQELRSSEDKYRRIVENPYIGSFIMVDGRLIYSNARLAAILETEVDRLSGGDFSVYVENKDYAALRNIFNSIVNGEKFGDRWEANGTTASGRHISLSGYSSVINIGNKRGVQSLIIDSTSEFREKEKMEQFERLESMATLAAGIAHDFNNILQVVLGSSQLLQRRLAETDLKKYADNITNVAIRGSDLSKRLLTFSRHKGLEEREAFDINEIILESLPLFEETFPRTIKIETQLSKAPIFVEGDQSQVQQVIFNLAVNARDAMPHGGTLTIKTEVRDVSAVEAEIYQVMQGSYAFIMIRDNGEGIAPELMSKIFEPFFTTKAPGKGTGLGLSVVYGIVRSHNGFLKAYSEVKKGTVFSIHLPVKASDMESKHAASKPPRVSQEAAPYGKKLLFVDDESGIREAAQFLLEQAGYTVLTAMDGMTAIEIYRTEWKSIDLVVLDLNMPELSGKEVLENLTVVNPDVRVLISTGYITSEERAGLKGIVEVIEKPFDFDQLVEKVRLVIDTAPYGRM